jgi:cation diffusion facilitator family transporter
MATAATTRVHLVRRGQRLEYFTILYNSLEALVALVAGFMAGSIALVGFGLDSLIEVTSGAALLWRLHHDSDPVARRRTETITLRIVGACFVALAVYVAWESYESLANHEAPERSIPGIVIAAASVVIMPLLARAKREVAQGIDSAALEADARQTDFCLYLSVVLLGGLVLNAAFDWWWADPLAGLVMTPIILREGWTALRGRTCCGGSCH